MGNTGQVVDRGQEGNTGLEAGSRGLEAGSRGQAAGSRGQAADTVEGRAEGIVVAVADKRVVDTNRTTFYL